MKKSGSEIRIRVFLCTKILCQLNVAEPDLESGIWCLLTLDPGSEMAKNPDPGSEIILTGPQRYSDHSSLGAPIPLNTAQ
jgi:hypothetical protein